MPGHDYITLKKLRQIATGTALTNGLIPLPGDALRQMYYQPAAKQLPLIKRCDEGFLWVDKYYVAYQIGDGDVQYTYITKHHIREEVNAYRAAARERETANQMPADIRAAFRVAQEYMKANATEVWIAPQWRDEKLSA